MSAQPEALRLADLLESCPLTVGDAQQAVAAAELRRLHAENERLVAEVANRNRRALAGDEAVSALANVHAYYEGLEAQRDALLRILREYVEDYQSEEGMYDIKHYARKFMAAIKAVEGEKK